MAKRTTQAQANGLFTGVLEGWVSLSEGLADIITQKAWKPLGYATFLEAWQHRLSDLSLSVKALTAVVYAMLNDGSSPEDIAYGVDGISAEGVRALVRQKDNGVPEDAASPFHREARRKNPQTTIFIHIGPDQYARYEEIARLADRTVTEIACKSVEQAFADIEAGLKRTSL